MKQAIIINWLVLDICKASFIKLAESRGMKVLKNNVCYSHTSLVVTDRYAAYNYFTDKNRQVSKGL